MLKVDVIHISLLPEYAKIDKGSGRCRVSSDLLPKSPTLRIGQVARIHIITENEEFDTLCSIWPDTHNQLRNGQVSIDNSVFIGPHSGWQVARGKIISIITPKACSSVRYSMRSLNNDNERGLKVMPSNTLPVLAGFTMNYSNHTIEIRATNPPTTCIPNHMTIWIREQAPQTPTSDAKVSLQANAARTKVVSRLIDKLVMPVLNDTPLATRYKGLMLLGPPGVGKSFAVQAVQQLCAADLQIEIVNISIPELLGEDDPITRLQQLLPSAQAPSSSSRNTINTKKNLTLYLIDEIDALGSGHHPSETQVAIKATLCHWLDNSQLSSSAIIATSNRAEDVDTILRRGGRLEHEINVLITTQDRYELIACYLPAISHYLTESSTEEMQYQFLLQELAERTGGYVAADIASLFAEVHRCLLDQQRSSSSLSSASLLNIFYEAMKSIPPSCLRGVRISQPNLSLKDVIGCEEAKLRLQQALSFTDPRHAAKLKRFNIAHNLGGVLLYGPPGNSKTRLVAAVASEYHLPLIALAAADVYSAYVGDAEAEIRKAFTLARQAAPCVLFFDELDSLVTNRSNDDNSGGGGQAVEARVLSTFLNEMDGVCGAASAMGVVVLAATNRLDCIDAALLRKGRFNQSVYVSLPNVEERLQLLHYFCSQAALTEGENAVQIAVDRLKGNLWEGMSGADVEALCKEEAMRQMEERLAARLQQGITE